MFITLNSADETECVTIQMKAIEQYSHMQLFIKLYKVALINFLSLWIKPKCVTDHLNESY